MKTWLFMKDIETKTDDFDDAQYIYIPSEAMDTFCKDYFKYDLTTIIEDCWLEWDGEIYEWCTVTTEDTLTRLNKMKAAIEEGEIKETSTIKPFTDEIPKPLYKVAVEIEPIGIVYLDCITENITDALNAISTAADANIFGKRAKKFTIEVYRG